jgi:hypothetical protein
MPVCELYIALERKGATYRPGEKIRGEVHVRVLEGCRCDALAVVCEWRTHGKGNVATAEHRACELASEDWEAGRAYDYPFELTAPAGPLTYHGTLVNVDWYLRARADVPWAFDPKTETEIAVVPWTADDIADAATGYRGGKPNVVEDYTHGPICRAPETSPARPSSEDRSLGYGCTGVGLVGALIMFLVWPVGVIGALGVVLIGIIVLLVQHGRTALQRGLGAPTVRLSADEAYAGDAVHVTLELTPPEPVKLFAASATLSGKEIVESGAGSSRTTHEHPLAEQARDLAKPGHRLEAGRHVLTARFEVPADAVPTFCATDNEVRWEVSVKISAEPGDWTARIPLVVRHPRALGGAARLVLE